MMPIHILVLPIIDFVSYYAHSGPLIDTRSHLDEKMGSHGKKKTACNKDPVLI